jgi:peptide/nickel transport system ATP-binding protein
MRREVQAVFQDPVSALDPRMRVGDIVLEPLHVLRLPGERRARVAEVLAAVGLSGNAARRYPHEFSGGQRQRIAIARALAPRPRVLLADEPVSALDVSVRAQILNLLEDLRLDFGLTLVLVSHDLSVVRQMSDRVLVMYRGRIVEASETRRLFRAPKHPYTRALLESIPRLKKRRAASR